MKFLGCLFYILAGLGVLVAFSSIAREMSQMGGASGSTEVSGLIGFMVGSFLIPAIFFMIGSSCMKKAKDSE